MEQMKNSGSILGGEPSGHVIFKNYSTTGDGAIGALKAIEAMKYYKLPLKSLVKDIKLLPQVTKNTSVISKPPLENNGPIQKILSEVKDKLGTNGRVLLRYSGTESLVRAMVEGQSKIQVEQLCQKLINVVSKELS